MCPERLNLRRVKDSSYIEEVKVLNDRLIYLNNLRVGVGKFHVLIVGAIFASSAIIQSLDLLTVLRIGGLPMLTTGVCVFVFDIKMRARVAAVARGIRWRTFEQHEKPPGTYNQVALERFGEDFFFALVLGAVNAFAFICFLASFTFSDTADAFMRLNSLLISIGIVLFVAVLSFEAWVWKYWVNRWGRTMDEWPA